MNNNIIYKMMKISFIVTCINSQASNVRADIFSLDDFDAAGYKRQYNTLPEVYDADIELKSSNSFVSFLKEAESLFTKYELESYVGLRLIHNHFSIEDNQIRAEEYKNYREIPSLITSSYEIEDAIGKNMIPASWIFSTPIGEEAKVFEASNDLAVHTGSKMIRENPDFLDEVAKLLDENKLSTLLSVAILRRDSLSANDDQCFLETDNSEHQQSVVQLWDSSKLAGSSITTSYSFKGPREHKCLPSLKCEPRGGGHKQIRNHLRNVTL